MDGRFLHSPGDRIHLGDFAATCSFKTASSIGFDLALASERTVLIGSLELHYPCSDAACPARIRIQLPDFAGTSLPEFVRQLFTALSIPSDTAYEAVHLVPETSVAYLNRCDLFLGLPCTRICMPDDIGVYLSILGEQHAQAVVEARTATLTDITAPILRYRNDRRSADEEVAACRGQIAAAFRDSGSAAALSDQIVDDFLDVNQQEAVFHNPPFRTVQSTRFPSKQAACRATDDATHWWRFSSVGYDRLHERALLHVDRVAAQSPFSVQRFFAYLNRETPQWSLAVTYPTSDARRLMTA